MPTAGTRSAGCTVGPRLPRSDFENLLAVVLPAVRADGVRQLHLTAGAVRAADERRGGRLPLRPAGPGVAARGLPLRNGHVGYSFVESSASTCRAASAAQRGSS